MCRRFTTSAALAVALVAAAAAQDPAAKPPADPKPRKPDPTEAAVAAALRNDPDVKIAQAKVQLAEAELAKARQGVVLKVMTLRATIEDRKAAVEIATQGYVRAEQLVKQGVAQQRMLLDARANLQVAQTALARAETELKLLTGDAGAAGPAQDDAGLALKWFAERMQSGERLDQIEYARRVQLAYLAYRDAVAVKGPIPDRIRAALDKTVKLGAKGEKVTFEKALEVFRKDAGLDVAVRGALPLRPVQDPRNPNEERAGPIEVVSEGEELPVGAWFQLFEDNAVFPQRSGAPTRFRFYVREYGLLVSSADAAPPDAPSLTEFWKQKPPAPKTETAPEPKAK